MIKSLSKYLPKIPFNQNSFINSLKATFACLLGLFIAKVFHLVQPQWVLISILIVMASQYRVGGAMIKGYSRLVATALGSSLAAMILFFFSAHVDIIYTVLFIFIAIFIYLANTFRDYSYSYALGAVTMVIIVVSNNPQLKNALDRLLEIMLGVSIAIIVTRFIYPIKAENILYKNISKTLLLLKDVYQLFIKEDKTFSVMSDSNGVEEDIIELLANQPILLKEACTESIFIRKHRHIFIVFLRLERRLLRSIYMLHYTLRASLKSFSNIIKSPEFTALHTEITLVIEDLSKNFGIENPFFIPIDLNTTYENIIRKLRTEFDQYSFEEKNKLHSFIFCLGHVILVLNRMKKIMLDTKQTK